MSPCNVHQLAVSEVLEGLVSMVIEFFQKYWIIEIFGSVGDLVEEDVCNISEIGGSHCVAHHSHLIG